MDAKKSGKYRTASEVGELVNALENCTLPQREWTHAAFITVAVWYLYLNPMPEARRLMRRAIRRYNFEHNLAGGLNGSYDEVLSYFWLCEVESFLKQNQRPGAPFVELVNNLIRRYADGNPPTDYYSFRRFYAPFISDAADTVRTYGSREQTI
jgi:hypothetical protein